MGWRFRKVFKILPGVRLNIGKKGISGVTLGPRGLSTSVGKRGVHQNVGVPGTGISFRQKVGAAAPGTGALVGLGIVAAIIVGVIGLCVVLAVIGRYSGQPRTEQPKPLVTAPIVTPMPAPSATPKKTQQRRRR